MANTKIYSVRCWDAFYETYTMIPVTNLTFKDAVTTALGLALFHDTMEYGNEELQVWVDTLTRGCAEMVGYVEYDPDDEESNEYGFIYRELF